MRELALAAAELGWVHAYERGMASLETERLGVLTQQTVRSRDTSGRWRLWYAHPNVRDCLKVIKCTA
jgi:hypothetical protein